jgi:outer membrane protein OmpA-like peptidoglycan-associated protein
MKILSIGLLAFLSWSVFSAYIYVCKIKGFCNEAITAQVDTINQFKMISAGHIPESQEIIKGKIPDSLTIYFAFDKSEFISDLRADNFFNRSSDYFDQNPSAMLNITGYADEVGSVEYNQALGYRRAERMREYFESKGLPENKITIVSLGEKEPAGDNNTTYGRAKNRRAIIGITK